MGCSSCGRKYNALRRSTQPATTGPAVSSVPRRKGIIRRSKMAPKTPVTQPQPLVATVITPPDRGPIDPSTGFSESVIKTGDNYSGDLKPGPHVNTEEKDEG